MFQDKESNEDPLPKMEPARRHNLCGWTHHYVLCVGAHRHWVLFAYMRAPRHETARKYW